MLKLLILTMVIPSLIQVTIQRFFEPTTAHRIYPDDVVTDPSNLPCNDSSDCPAGYGCRDSNGNIRYWYKNEVPNVIPGPGTCGCATRPGEICFSDNDCPKTYICYRIIIDWCPPKYCVTPEWAEYETNHYTDNGMWVN